jgi:hypothetical protein
MMLSEISGPSAVSVGTWVVGAVFCVTGLGGVIGVFVMRREYESKTKELERRIDTLEETLTREREASTESRRKLYEHVDHVRQELSEKIDLLPDRVVALLRNTGVIK